MKRQTIILVLLTILFLTPTVFAKKYKLLFDKGCSYIEAIEVLHSLNVPYDVEKVSMQGAMITVYAGEKLDFQKIQTILDKNKKVTRFVVSTPIENEDYLESMKKEGKMDEISENYIQSWKEYKVTFVLKIGVELEEVQELIKKTFEVDKVSVAKNANEIIVEVANEDWVEFLNKISKEKMVLDTKEVLN